MPTFSSPTQADQQRNSSDCGVYLLKYVEVFFGLQGASSPAAEASAHVGLLNYQGKTQTMPMKADASMAVTMRNSIETYGRCVRAHVQIDYAARL